MRRVAVLFLSQLLLWALIGELNHALSGAQVHVFAAALYIAFATLWLPWRNGFALAFLGGLLCDVGSPVYFGMHAILFAAAHVATFPMRERLPRDEPLGQIIIVLLVNLGIFVAVALSQMDELPDPRRIWPRLLVDLVASQVLVGLITPWFFALQARALALARADRENFA